MATKAPYSGPLPVPVTIQDRERARISMLQDADRGQHALMTGTGGQPSWSMMHVEADTLGTGVSGQVMVRVPPGVTHVHVMAHVTGIGTLRVTSMESMGAMTAIDTEGCLLTIAQGTSETLTTAGLTKTSVVDDTLTDAPRAVTVSSTVTWEWQTVILEVTVTPSSDADAPTYHAQVWGIGIYPIHVPRDAT